MGYADEAGRCQKAEWEGGMSDEGNTFSNGLTESEEAWLVELRIMAKTLIENVKTLPAHRSLSIAVTKIEEADHWIRDRGNKPA